MSMNFTELESKSTKQFIGIGAVIFLHLIVAYILMSGLTNEIKKPTEQPVELQIIQDIKPPRKLEEPKLEDKPPELPKVVEQVAKIPELPKQAEKITSVSKPTPVTLPTKSVTPAPSAAATTSTSPVSSEAPVAALASKPAAVGVTRGASQGEAGCKKPDYPRESLIDEEQGTTLISVHVDENGKAIGTKVKKSSGSRNLDKAAAKAWSLCTFKPAMKDGVPYDTWVDIEYAFVLD